MNSKVIVPIILSGGSGKRLWPLSRKTFPKQYISFNNDSKNSLLQITQKRISEIEDLEKSIIICNEEHRFIVAEQMREINFKPASILLEPFGKNTAPAITLGALKAISLYKDPILLVLSSDHQIKDNKKFLRVIQKGIELARENKLVTFGILPTHPETGYGYIETFDDFKENKIEGLEIKRFIEKPSIEKAKNIFSKKQFSWNSGIFIFKAEEILNEIKLYQPKIFKYCKESLDSKLFDLDFQRLKVKSFEKCPDISIDYAVMEKTKKGLVIQLDAGWTDLGSWQAVWDSGTKDSYGNVSKGNIFLKDTKDSLISSEKKLVIGLGLEDLIIVDTNDALLVSKKNRSQEIKEVVEHLQKSNIPEMIEHKTIYRPWGNYTSIAENKNWKVKKIYVKPNESLSLQMHYKRAEHWVIVSGKAKVEIDEKVILLERNQNVYIPKETKHRLTNCWEIP